MFADSVVINFTMCPFIHCLLLYLQVKYHIKKEMLTLNSWDVQQFFLFVLVEMELS